MSLLPATAVRGMMVDARWPNVVLTKGLFMAKFELHFNLWELIGKLYDSWAAGVGFGRRELYIYKHEQNHELMIELQFRTKIKGLDAGMNQSISESMLIDSMAEIEAIGARLAFELKGALRQKFGPDTAAG